MLGCVAVGVLTTLVFALSPFWSGPEPVEDGAAPAAPSTGPADPEVVGLESPTPSLAFSPVPVSLSTRAALPPRAPVPTHPPSGPTVRPMPLTTTAPKTETMRCLKRYIVRETFRLLASEPQGQASLPDATSTD
ncbi:hypothetical protein [Micromonospora sp. DT47]|uniref:hypothetical protein n=1 Tax=Micromonospora sp. DT47 TaxID=3393431 RepID=UPI003CE821CE